MATGASSFPLLFEELGNRWKAPQGHVSFWVYLILAIILAGAIGIWVEVYRAFNIDKFDATGIITAIYTYFPAIAAGSSIQLIMELDREDEKHLRSFSLFCGALILLLTLPFFSGSKSIAWLWSCGIAGALLSIWLWWIANAYSKAFQDFDPENPLGGNTKKKLHGNLQDFQT